jgi:imidazolonepropionase
VTDAEAGERRLLIRDLEQLATPAGRGAPLRGRELGTVEVIEHAYVLCAGGRIEAVDEMSRLALPPGEVEEVEGRGLCAIPGLVDCHTHACFAGDRVEEFSLRAAGASYEELHAAGGGILATVEATRASIERPSWRRCARSGRPAGFRRSSAHTRSRPSSPTATRISIS